MCEQSMVQQTSSQKQRISSSTLQINLGTKGMSILHAWCLCLKAEQGVHEAVTFFDFHRENIHFLHPLLQFILCRCCHRVHLIITSVIVFIGKCGEYLNKKQKNL